MAATKRAARTATTGKAQAERDAIDLLREDHAAVSELFKQFESAEDEGEKSEIVEQICEELTIHAAIEEEIFYPAVREEVEGAEDLLDEAEVEHGSLKDLVSQLETASPGDDLFDAKVTVLGEYVKHHVKEEQDELFPKVRRAKLDLEALGQKLAARKAELQGAGPARSKGRR